tara:strand:+ start:151 stop:465 length:315 start_codon:yes stop_codon:yes gene_type:complete
MKTLHYDKILVFGFVWILLISLIDHYLTIKFQDNIVVSERNPIGVWLIQIDGGSVALFMTLKMACLWIIATFLLRLYKIKKQLAYIGLGTLSLAQLLLVFYLLQ